jgi:hypothetical protein
MHCCADCYVQPSTLVGIGNIKDSLHWLIHRFKSLMQWYAVLNQLRCSSAERPSPLFPRRGLITNSTCTARRASGGVRGR